MTFFLRLEVVFGVQPKVFSFVQNSDCKKNSYLELQVGRRSSLEAWRREGRVFKKILFICGGNNVLVGMKMPGVGMMARGLHVGEREASGWQYEASLRDMCQSLAWQVACTVRYARGWQR